MALVGVAWLTSGCGRRETPVDSASQEQMLLLGNGTEPPDLDPQIVTGMPETNIVKALFEGLTRLDPRTLEPKPGVAQSWDISADGLVYTFHLREDAQWSNGEPLAAEDFYRSFQRILTPSLGSELAEGLYYVVGAEAYHKGTLSDFSEVGFRVLDPHTLEITLRNPTPFILQLMAGRDWSPVPLSVVSRFGGMDRKGTDWTRAENIVGNGPFVLQDWKPNQYLTVTKSPTYWNRDAVKLNAVRFFSIDSQVAEEAAFRAGRLHKTDNVPLSRVSYYRRENPEVLRIAPWSGNYHYAFNVNRAPFDDVRVRRAFALAVDRESLTTHIVTAGETPAYNFTPPGTGGDYTFESPIRYDPDEARRLLAEAGFPNGDGFPAVTLLYNTLESHKIIGEAIQQMWKTNLGLDVQLHNVEWGVYLDLIHAEDFQIARRGLIVDPYDPWLFLRSFETGYGFNNTGWSNPEYDALIRRIEATVDRATRTALCQEAEALLLREMPILPIYFYTRNYLISPDVQDWSDNLAGEQPLTRAWLAN